MDAFILMETVKAVRKLASQHHDRATLVLPIELLQKLVTDPAVLVIWAYQVLPEKQIAGYWGYVEDVRIMGPDCTTDPRRAALVTAAFQSLIELERTNRLNAALGAPKKPSTEPQKEPIAAFAFDLQQAPQRGPFPPLEPAWKQIERTVNEDFQRALENQMQQPQAGSKSRDVRITPENVNSPEIQHVLQKAVDDSSEPGFALLKRAEQQQQPLPLGLVEEPQESPVPSFTIYDLVTRQTHLQEKLGQKFPTLKLTLHEAKDLLQEQRSRNMWDYTLSAQELLRGNWGTLCGSPIQGPDTSNDVTYDRAILVLSMFQKANVDDYGQDPPDNALSYQFTGPHAVASTEVFRAILKHECIKHSVAQGPLVDPYASLVVLVHPKYQEPVDKAIQEWFTAIHSCKRAVEQTNIRSAYTQV